MSKPHRNFRDSAGSSTRDYVKFDNIPLNTKKGPIDFNKQTDRGLYDEFGNITELFVNELTRPVRFWDRVATSLRRGRAINFAKYF
jgi:hypothetical protein